MVLTLRGVRPLCGLKFKFLTLVGFVHVVEWVLTLRGVHPLCGLT